MTEPPAGTPAATDRRERVYLAVVALGTGTAAEIAAEAGIPYSTVTPKLRSLADEGRAEAYHDDERRTRWRPTTAATVDSTDDPSSAPDPGESTDVPVDGDITADTNTTDAPSTGDDPSPHSDTDVAGADRAEADGTEADAAPADPDTAAAKPAKTRRRDGQVPEEILAVFANAEPGTEYKPQQLHHLTGISVGAINQALVGLVDNGQLVQTVIRPATYRRATPQ